VTTSERESCFQQAGSCFQQAWRTATCGWGRENCDQEVGDKECPRTGELRPGGGRRSAMWRLCASNAGAEDTRTCAGEKKLGKDRGAGSTARSRATARVERGEGAQEGPPLLLQPAL